MEQYLKLYKTSNEYYEDSNKPVIPHIIDIVSFNPEPPVVNPCEIDTMCPVVSPENAYIGYQGGTITITYNLGVCWTLISVNASDADCICINKTININKNNHDYTREFIIVYRFINVVTGIECERIVNIVQYGNTVIDPFNGHEYVDLGLPSGTLWAKMNVGAERELDNGKRYQWGATEEYNKNKIQYYTGETLTREHDIVNISMGGSWITPSKEDFEELIANTYIALMGNYVSFQNKNDRSKYIKIPSSGFYRGSEINMVGECAYLWSNKKGYALDSCPNCHINDNFCYECGLPVRGVVKL